MSFHWHCQFGRWGLSALSLDGFSQSREAKIHKILTGGDIVDVTSLQAKHKFLRKGGHLIESYAYPEVRDCEKLGIPTESQSQWEFFLSIGGVKTPAFL
jgi:hypothetical protein